MFSMRSDFIFVRVVRMMRNDKQTLIYYNLYLYFRSPEFLAFPFLMMFTGYHHREVWIVISS